uniref:Serine/arginine-rich splicing factor 2 n=1 Tax=Parastrongyloides trichosuri TaxID=131310 RepID=A0A0N4Z8Q7_PARTI
MGERRGPPNISGLYSVKVDNLSYNTTQHELRRLFDRYGEIGDIHIPRDRNTRQSKGFGFVRFYDKRDAEYASNKCDGRRLDGRSIRCSLARYERPIDERPRGGGRGRRDRSRSPSYKRRRSRSRSPIRSRSRSPIHSRSASPIKRSVSPRRSRSRSRDYSRSKSPESKRSMSKSRSPSIDRKRDSRSPIDDRGSRSSTRRSSSPENDRERSPSHE